MGSIFTVCLAWRPAHVRGLANLEQGGGAERPRRSQDKSPHTSCSHSPATISLPPKMPASICLRFASSHTSFGLRCEDDFLAQPVLRTQ